MSKAPVPNSSVHLVTNFGVPLAACLSTPIDIMNQSIVIADGDTIRSGVHLVADRPLHIVHTRRRWALVIQMLLACKMCGAGKLRYNILIWVDVSDALRHTRKVEMKAAQVTGGRE